MTLPFGVPLPYQPSPLVCRFLISHLPAVLGLQFHQLAAVFLLLPLHLLLQQLDTLVTGGNFVLQCAVVGFQLFQFAAAQKMEKPLSEKSILPLSILFFMLILGFVCKVKGYSL